MPRHVTRTLAAAGAGAVTILSLTAAGGARATGGIAAASAPGAAQAAPGPANPPSGGTPLYTNANCPRTPIIPLPPPPPPPPPPPAPAGPNSAASRSSATPPVAPVPPVPPACTAGYQASGRDFRYAQALITVPEHTGDIAADPLVYVGLDASVASTSDYALAGIEPNVSSPSGWDTLVQVQEPTLATPLTIVQAIPDALEGDGIFFSVYLNAAGNSLHFVMTLPDGTTTRNTVPVSGPVYTVAEAFADWSGTTTSPEPTTPAATTRVSQFFRGRFTTANGQPGTFEGPWTLNPVEITSNGLAAPLGTVLGAPSYLWNDGISLPGQGTDAFGVWLYR
jgi:hypothetical protein